MAVATTDNGSPLVFLPFWLRCPHPRQTVTCPAPSYGDRQGAVGKRVSSVAHLSPLQEGTTKASTRRAGGAKTAAVHYSESARRQRMYSHGRHGTTCCKQKPPAALRTVDVKQQSSRDPTAATPGESPRQSRNLNGRHRIRRGIAAQSSRCTN